MAASVAVFRARCPGSARDTAGTGRHLAGSIRRQRVRSYVRCYENHVPLCRHHHRCKRAEGWHLEQPEPGVLIWRTPAGRTYATTPTEYPV